MLYSAFHNRLQENLAAYGLKVVDLLRTPPTPAPLVLEAVRNALHPLTLPLPIPNGSTISELLYAVMDGVARRAEDDVRARQPNDGQSAQEGMRLAIAEKEGFRRGLEAGRAERVAALNSALAESNLKAQFLQMDLDGALEDVAVAEERAREVEAQLQETQAQLQETQSQLLGSQETVKEVESMLSVCAACQEKMANQMPFACQHVWTCDDCAPLLKDCPACHSKRKRTKAKWRVYLP